MGPEPLSEDAPLAKIEELLVSLRQGKALSGESLLLKAVLEETPEAVVLAGMDGDHLFLNAAAQALFSRTEMPPVPLADWPKAYGTYHLDGTTLFDYRDLPLVKALHGEKTDGVEIFQKSDRFPQGLFLLVRGRPLRDPSGKLLGGVIFCQDITRLKREQVRAQRLADLVAFAPVSIIETSPEARIVSWNAAAEAIYGYKPSEIVGKNYSMLVPSHKIPLMLLQIQQLLRGESIHDYETARIHKDGHVIMTRCSASPLLEPDGKVRGFVLVTRDITGQVLPYLAEHVPDGILMVSPDSRVTGWNPSAEKIFGYPREQALGKPFPSLFAKEALAKVDHLLESAFLGSALSDYNTQALDKDGGAVEVSLSLSPCRDKDGKVVRVSVVLRDITELKLAESRISQWKSIVDSSTEGVARNDLEGHILYWNKGCERIFGYSEQEVLGKPWSVLVPVDRPEDFPLVLQHIREGRGAQYQAVRLRKDGKRIDVSVSLAPLQDREGRLAGASLYIQDVTERVRLKEALRQQEQQVLQSQKMEVVGRLAGGVAHDFTNLLTAVHVNAQLLAQEKLGEEGHEALESIRNTVDRAVELTRQLLTFSRKQVTAPRVLDLNALVVEEIRLLQRMVKEVQLEFTAGEGVPPIEADPTEMRQVLMNLVLNARDAMPKGTGNVTFTTRLWMSEGKAPNESRLAPGPYAWLSAKDDGSGMDDETKKRIFEPFFTTKEEGKGTGLGLAIVYSVVTKRGGALWVESAPGAGTTFNFLFPATPK